METKLECAMTQEKMTVRLKMSDLLPIPLGKTFDEVVQVKIQEIIKRQTNLGWEVGVVDIEPGVGVVIHLVR